MLFNPSRLIGLLLLINASLLAQPVDNNPQSLKNLPDTPVSVQPVRISVGHNLPEWTFEFVPDEYGLNISQSSLVSGIGSILITDSNKNIIQIINAIPVSVPKDWLDKVKGQLFFFDDFNKDGYQDILNIYSPGFGPNYIHDLYSFDPKIKQFRLEEDLSYKGQIDKKRGACVLVTYFAGAKTTIKETYCFSRKKTAMDIKKYAGN